MSTTTYSERIKGDRGNFDLDVRFDMTHGYLGVTQTDDGTVKDRVLLCPAQVKELVAFVEANKRRRS